MFSDLLVGELFQSSSISKRSCMKYLNALFLISDFIPKEEKSLNAKVSLAITKVSNLPRSKQFDLLLGPFFRSVIDRFFLDYYNQRTFNVESINYLCDVIDSYGLHPSDHTKSNSSLITYFVHSKSTENTHEHATIKKLFSEHMADTVGTVRCCIVDPEAEHIEMLIKALSLLDKLHPNLADEITYHVKYIALIDTLDPNLRQGYREIAQGVSSHSIPSTCFFSYHSFKSVEILAEAIYHESLHKKLSNTLYINNYLKTDIKYSGKFCSHWNKPSPWNSNKWEYDRVLYANHFYSHLYSLYKEKVAIDLFGEIARHKTEIYRQRMMDTFEWIQLTGINYLSKSGFVFFNKINSMTS
ncbi:hypothetical protein [Vibrio parahaemolyticus]|uniref:hypothetical protein n=1 Tax=Vibrio parahaemolyticus TaxID=670 RepID=UPI00235EFEAC|nr:hypothetical protein [Vibrio parahaemolyticus]